VGLPWERKFLGFRISAYSPPLREIAPKSIERFKHRVRGLTRRTAVYGSVRTVVWEGQSRETPPYPD